MDEELSTTRLLNFTLETSEAPWRFNNPVERRLVGGILIFIGLAGLIGNALVIIAFILSEKLQNITNIFVINLAVSDFLSCLLVPFFVQNVLTENERLLPDWICAMVGILLYVFVSSSIVNHAVIAANRYLSISRPVSVYRRIFSPGKIVIMVILIWTYASIIPLVTHLSRIIQFGYNSKYRICSLDVVDMTALIVSFVRALAVDVVCLIIVVIFYVKFFLFIKRHSNQLMHIYSYDRRDSDLSSKRGSDPSQVRGMTRQTTTVTRIVDLDAPVEVETVVGKSAETRRKVWRQMGRSVSQAIMTPPTEAFNGRITEDIIEEEDEAKSTEEADDHETIIEVEAGSETKDSKKMSECSETLSAIDETEENITPNRSVGSLEVPAAPVEETNDDKSVEDCDVEHLGMSSESSVNAKQAGTTESLDTNKTCNNSNDDVRHSSSSTDESTSEHISGSDDEAFERSTSATSNDEDGGGTARREQRDSGSPTHSAIVNRRRKFSEFVQRSFFGRSSSVTSHSERVRSMQVRLNKRQVQITKNLFVVVCAFIFCISQYIVFLTIPSLERLLPYSAVLITAGHAVNPIIYAMKHPTFKEVLRPMLTCKLSKIPGPSRALKAIMRT